MILYMKRYQFKFWKRKKNIIPLEEATWKEKRFNKNIKSYSRIYEDGNFIRRGECNASLIK